MTIKEFAEESGKTCGMISSKTRFAAEKTASSQVVRRNTQDEETHKQADCGESAIDERSEHKVMGFIPCEHGRRKDRCKECGGCGICEHGRRRTHCKECGALISASTKGRGMNASNAMGLASVRMVKQSAAAKNAGALRFVTTERSSVNANPARGLAYVSTVGGGRTARCAGDPVSASMETTEGFARSVEDLLCVNTAESRVGARNAGR